MHRLCFYGYSDDTFGEYGVSGREIELIVEGCLQLGFKLGMFDSKKEED